MFYCSVMNMEGYKRTTKPLSMYICDCEGYNTSEANGFSK